MAIDEAIAQSVRNGQSPPALRIYEWTTPSVSIGCFQKIGSLNLTRCSTMGIPIVRRLTGGRAILHADELTYSVSAPTTHGPFSYGLRDSYQKISRAFCGAISALGLFPEAQPAKAFGHANAAFKNPLCFHATSFAEITLRSRKVCGSAQKRWSEALLQQGSIPYFIHEEAVRQIFDIPPSVDLKKRMIGLREIVPDLSHERFREAIVAAFEETFQMTFIPSSLSEEELLLARELQARRYLSPEWVLQG
jgi:lipoate-protein ligase A